MQSTYSQIMTLQRGPPRSFGPIVSSGHYRFNPGTSGFQNIAMLVTDGFNPIPAFSMAFGVQQGPCSLQTATATTDASGIATVGVALPATLASCMVLAQPNVGGEVIIPENNKVRLRTYVAPSDMLVWTGVVSSDWLDEGNWLPRRVPDATTDVFIAASTGSQSPGLVYPKMPSEVVQETHALITEALSLIDLNGQELYVRDSLAADGPIIGPGVVALGVAETRIRGTVQALLELGEDGCPTFNQYVVSGPLFVDSILANCKLRLADENAVVIVSGEFRSMPQNGDGSGGGLIQNSGVLVVGGNAILDGQSSLTGGSLQIAGTLSHTGGCTRSMFAAPDHTTIFTGETSNDPIRVTWNDDVECHSRLGTVHVATTGEGGLAFSGGSTLFLEHLQIGPGATLRVPAEMRVETLQTIGLGVVIFEGGTLWNDGTIVVTNGGTGCPVPAGKTTGPYQCVNIGAH
jgi:hypothetical protein